ncbi:transcription factor giant isoform X1 [Megalopta genalis]|uniref:transcription factor giant isoform X1 n=1 Tax=Megalopta genalis TaxID=115081 RepID=UPI003FD39F7A
MDSLSHTMLALDFTTTNNNSTSDSSEPAILDLSCKKNILLSSQEQASCSSRSNSPASSEKQPQRSHFPGSEAKSPFEARLLMLTPPSDSDSPKSKHGPIYNCFSISSNNAIEQTRTFSMQPIPVVPTVMNDTMPISLGVGTSVPSPYGSDTEITSEMGKKLQRPFKAYPKDPLTFTAGRAEAIYDQESTEAYSEFRKRMLETVKKSNETTNIKMKRVSKSPILPTSTDDEKDAAYWERRRKNNEAAKRSRDARRAKEDEIAIRAAFLEQENMRLRYEVIELRKETAKLRCLVYSK